MTSKLSLADGAYKEIKLKMLNWIKQFSIFLLLDNNNYPSAYPGYEMLAGICAEGKEAVSISSLGALQQWHDKNKNWALGHIAYDYKNNIEPKLFSAHRDHPEFPLMHFFCPDIVCFIDREKAFLTITSATEDTDKVLQEIVRTEPVRPEPLPKLSFKRRIQRQQYITTVQRLRQHIKDGDCYEINFCNEGYCEQAAISAPAAYHALNTLSPAPFAAFYRLHDRHMMCSSPERYIKKQGAKLIAQPIKGTARRDGDAAKDMAIKTALYNDIKERAENVMIVDLMRNDLARCCQTGTVHVDELFGIYTFPQVHQMISTISGTMKQQLPFTDVLRYTFPMGSMTGAPKIKVMQLIEQYEQAARGLYSGAVGYITPEGNFDFNVVIRSLFYNAATQYLCYQAGGAITYDSEPEKEWEEMETKAWAMERVFGG